MLFEISNFEESVNAYKKAIELNPRNSSYYQFLSEVLEEAGNLQEAFNVNLSAMKLYPKKEDFYDYLGTALFFQNDLQGALKLLKKTDSLDNRKSRARGSMVHIERTFAKCAHLDYKLF